VPTNYESPFCGKFIQIRIQEVSWKRIYCNIHSSW
jgi:hypothetical protein